MAPKEFISVVRSSLWIYLASLTNSIFGFLFWLIVSAISGPSVIGYVSATSSMALLISSVLNLGVPRGMVKWIGEYSERDPENARKYFWTSLIFLFLIYLLPSLAILYLGFTGCTFLNYGPTSLIFVSILLLISLSGVFASMFVALMRTFPYLVAILVGNIAKLSTGISLLYLGLGWVGAIIGYMMSGLIIDSIGLIYAFISLGTPHIGITHLKDLIKAGVPTWLPSMVMVLGQQLAVIFAFSYLGAFDTGRFYIAMAASGFVVGIGGSIQQIMLPYLSGLEDGRKRAAWRGLRVGLGFTLPLAVSIFLFPDYLLGLLGKSYRGAWLELELILMANILILISSAVTNLCYSKDMFRQVLNIGLAISIPRLIFYSITTPFLGSRGVALSYLLGSITGLYYASTASSKLRFRLDWRILRKALLASMLGIFPALPFRLAGWLWILGAVISITVSLLALMKASVLKEEDIRGLGRAIIPSKFKPMIYILTKPLLNAIYS